MICKNCGRENKNGIVKCEFCNRDLNIHHRHRQNDEMEHYKMIFKCIMSIGYILFFICLYFICDSIIFFTSNIYKKNKYNQINGTLVEYINCYYNETYEACDAIYEYEINDKNYTIRVDSGISKENYNKVETIYYNPIDPSDSITNNNSKNTISIIKIFIGIILLYFPVNIIKFTKKYKEEKEKNILIKEDVMKIENN